MDLEIKKQNGQKYTLGDFGFVVDDVIIESMEIEDNYETKENTSGRILLSSQYRKRKINVKCHVNSTKLNDNARLRDEFYNLTNSTEEVWIRELRRSVPLNYRFIEPLEDDYQEISEYNNLVLDHEEFNDNYYVNGKRYKVKNADVIVPEENGKKISFELVFETTEIPFAESIGTSLDLEKRPDKELWSNDMLIPFDEQDGSRIYSFTNIWNNTIYYHGTADNDQFNMYKKVTIILGEDTENFTFTMTHSDVMTIRNIKMKKGDKIEYDGVQTFKNGTPLSYEVSGSQPKFRHGWNEFEFNQQVKSVKFDMKFYYK